MAYEILFLIESFLKFFRDFKPKGEEISVKILKETAMHYIKEGQFVFDVIALIPF